MKVNKTLILNKIQEHYKFKKDSDFAAFLDVGSNVLSNWKKRNTFDIEILYTKCEDVSTDFLITGEEPILKSNFESEVIKSTKEPMEEYMIENKLVQAHKKTIQVLENAMSDQQTVIDELRNDKKLLVDVIQLRLQDYQTK